MQQITDALIQLLSKQPKQATTNLQMLMNTDSNFFSNLTKIILNNSSYQNRHIKNNQIQKAAIVTLNTLSIRSRSKNYIQDYLALQEIFDCIKKVLISKQVLFQHKKLLTPALSQFFKNALSTHKQILQLKEQLNLSQNPQSALFLVYSIIKSKQIHKPIQIQCIVQLFDIILNEGQKYVQNVLNNNSRYTNFNKLQYLIQLLVYIFKIFKDITQPYQYQALLVLSSNNSLVKILITVLEWKNQQDRDNRYKYIWQQDIKINNNQCIQLYDVNNIKQKVIKILSFIISKTDPNFNIYNTQHKLFHIMPQILSNILHQIYQISPQFKQLNKDYLIGSLCDAMLQYISQCVSILDLQQILIKQFSSSFIYCLLQYIQIRDNDIQNIDDEDFVNFIQGFIAQFNLDDINRYGVVKLIRVCCKKIDIFAFQFYMICYNGIIDGIRRRINNDIKYRRDEQDFYQHLYISNGNTNINYNDEYYHNNFQITTVSYLLGIISLQQSIKKRTDFQSHLIQLFITLDFHHFNQQQIPLLYYILSRHTYLFLNQSFIDTLPKLLKYISIISTNQYTNISILHISLQFIKQLYIKCLINIQINNKNVQKYVNIIYNNIWNIFVNAIDYKYGELQIYYDILLDMVNIQYIINTNTNNYDKNIKKQKYQKYQLHSIMNKKCNMQINDNNNNKNGYVCKMETIGDYLIYEIALFMFMILQKLCKKLAIIVIKQGHDGLIALRIHQGIVQCIESLHLLNNIQVSNNYNNNNNPNMSIKKIQLQQYIQPISSSVKQILSSQESSNLSVQQLQNLQQLLSILILQQHSNPQYKKYSQSKIPQQLFQSLLPIMLQYPFSQTWLTCLCQFIHRIQGKLSLDQIYKIYEMIRKGYSNHSNNQQIINQLSLFAIVLLNYYQPQNWDKIHEIVRVTLIKYISVSQSNNNEEKVKKLIKYGFGNQNIFSITTIRLFHVYLFGFKIQSNNKLLAQILQNYGVFIQKYCLIQTTHLIIGLKSSYRQINNENLQKIIDYILLILNKLVMNSNYYGKQTMEQTKIRKLSQKIGFMAVDPYEQFRQLVNLLKQDGINLTEHQKHGNMVKNMMNITTYMGQPRKMYSISKKMF